MRDNSMRETVFRFARLAAGALALVTPACSGGSGPLPDFDGNTEPFEGRRESPGDGREAPPVSNEGPQLSDDRSPGTSGTGGFQCAGTFDCVASSRGQQTKGTLTLSQQDDVCMAGSGRVLTSEGTVLINDRQIGTWSKSSDGGFSVTIDGVVTTCTPKR